MKDARIKQGREAVKTAQVIKTLRKLKFMLSLVEECNTDSDEVKFSELDAGKDTIGGTYGVVLPTIQCLMETYLEIVGEFETVLPYVEAVLKAPNAK